MSDIRVGLVGCGGMGKGLVSQLVTIEGAQLVAGADSFAEGREAFAKEYNVPGFASLEEMLAGIDLDGVIIATPNSFHMPNTVTAAAAGKHVFSEKPMALTLADCQAMIDACNQAGVKLQIGQVLRYLPDFNHAWQFVQSGQIGQPRHGMIFRYSGPKQTWGNKVWRDDPAQVGHYLFEVSVHEIDFMRCIFGKPIAVNGWDVNVNPDIPLWAMASTGVIEFEGGGICIIVEGCFNPIPRTEMEFTGTTGAIRFGWGGPFTAKFNDGREDIEKTGAEIAEGYENGLRREIREWIEAIANDTPCTIPGEEGKANIELALAILESSRRRERIVLPL
jgi:predicted dehydrogenase